MARDKVSGRIVAVHGLSRTPTYQAWKGMKARCLNPNDPAYADYGGRGITICERWIGQTSFPVFLADMGERPARHLLDRIDNDRGYEPSNCRWVSFTVSNRNRRISRFVEFRGERVLVLDLARQHGMTYPRLVARLKTMSLDEALSKPVRKWVRKHEPSPPDER